MTNFQLQEDLLTTLGDTTRLAILECLRKGPLTAGDIIKILNKNPSTISQHLKKLTDSNILIFKQDGTQKTFQIREMQVFDIINALNAYIGLTNVDYEKFDSGKKVLLLGLDQSGKTSILLSIFGQKNLMNYYSLTATKGYKHAGEILSKMDLPLPNTETIFYEGGGQKVYRDSYLKDPQKYLGGFDKLIFVIDVRDMDRYEEALSFLQEILNELKKICDHFTVAIYLHKFDPELELDPEYSSEKININLIDKIRAIIPSRFSYQILKSTIFTIFRRSSIMIFQQNPF